MSGLDLALVNAALANRAPGTHASAVETIDHFVAQGTNVARVRIAADPSSTAALPPTMIAKWTTGPAHLPEVRSEIATHRTALATMPDVPAPACHGWMVREQDHAALLLTEDLAVEHDRPGQPVPLDILERIVDAIARVHAAWW